MIPQHPLLLLVDSLQFKTPASVAQNRESQRQSRARRKELVEDLKERLGEYERRGMAASLEMQAVARAVSIENQHLRALLELHGVSRDRVAQYLASRTELESTGLNGASGAERSSQSPQREGIDDQELGPRSLHEQQTSGSLKLGIHEALPLPMLPQTTRPNMEPMDSAATPTNEMESRHKSSLANHQWASDCVIEPIDPYRNTHPPIRAPPPVSDCFSLPEHSAPDLGHREALQTSCDVAAAILVELHSQTDHERARVALGCKGTSNCSVNNVKIFQLMDKLG